MSVPNETTEASLRQTVERANDTHFWTSLAARLRDEGSRLCGWHYGTFWIRGTPAPLLGLRLRGGGPLRVTYTPYHDRRH